MIFEIKINGSWHRVTYGIFRSWSGGRRYNGTEYVGAVHEYGQGLPNPWTEDDALELMPKELAADATAEAIKNGAGKDWKIER